VPSLRVCFIVSSYEPGTVGGQGEVVLKLQKNLLERSVEAYVLTSGMEIQGYPCTVRTRCGKRLFYSVSAAYLKWIRKMDFDVINVHADSGLGLIPFLAAEKCRAKIVTTLHNSYLSEQRSIRRLEGFQRRHAHPNIDEYILKYLLTPVKFFGTYVDCAFSDRIVAVSAWTRETCKVEYGIPEEKISVIHNGVDLTEFNPQIARTRIRSKFSLGENPIILSVGCASIWKGLPYLIRSMVDVTAKLPDAKLIVVGSKRYKSQMQLLARDLGIQENVLFPGLVTREELSSYYSACDVVAMPTTCEGFPIVVLEAMASGRPVVASRVGGIPEAIETGSNGILFDPGNISQLAQALLCLLEDEPLRRDMGHKARLVAETNYDWKKITETYIAEFKRLL
jgi:glycosyltransferase involved in cell wall biosynthesis